MFPSQPQIGQDMAKERQELAENIRLAQDAARADRKPRRVFNPLRWIRGILSAHADRTTRPQTVEE